MDTRNINYGNGIYSGVFMLISGILGYFVYGSIDGVLGMILLTFFLSLCLFLAFIPFCGVAIQAVVLHFMVIPFLLTLTTLEETWLITGLFWVYVSMGLVLTGSETCTTMSAIIRWKK